MLRMVFRPTRLAVRIASAQYFGVFDGSEVRSSVIPLAANRSNQRSVIAGGVNWKASIERLRIDLSGVCFTRLATNRPRSQRSSFKSRTHFLKNAEDKSSIPSKPARSIFSTMGSIMPVVMLDAQRLSWPSRKVVSTKWMSFMYGCKFLLAIEGVFLSVSNNFLR
jgi:hypothetical protein